MLKYTELYYKGRLKQVYNILKRKGIYTSTKTRDEKLTFRERGQDIASIRKELVRTLNE